MKRLAWIAAAALLAAHPVAAVECVFYFGGLHSHTSYSDGMGVPEEAFAMARDQAGLDYWAVTDHFENLTYVRREDGSTTDKKAWDATLEAVDAFTEDGRFIAMIGWEWTNNIHGHMNVLNEPTEPPFFLQYHTYDRFRPWVRKHPDALVGFNHPGGSAATTSLWDGFEYIPEFAPQVFFVEVNGYRDFEHYYTALDQGWRVGPAPAQDNHDRSWGLRDNLVGVCAEELTHESLFRGFRARRFMGTNSRDLGLDLRGNGERMGAELEAHEVGFRIEVAARGEWTEPIRVMLVSNGGEVVEEWFFEGETFFVAEPEITVDFEGKRWFIAQVEAANRRFAITAPVWVSRPGTGD